MMYVVYVLMFMVSMLTSNNMRIWHVQFLEFGTFTLSFIQPDREISNGPNLSWVYCDAILPRRGPITRVMARGLQENWIRDVGEGFRILMNLRVDFGFMG